MLSNLNFIRKRKGNKVNESGRGHQQSPSVSSVGSNVVLDIKEDSSSLSATQSSSLVVQLNITDSDGPWFPQDLLRSRSRSPEEKVTGKALAREVRPSTSPGDSGSVSTSVAHRKKSIPAPILIPGAGLLMPHVQIGNSARAEAPLPALPQPNADPAVLNPPSPSTSENLSSISGTTLARALIASSFTLSSSEHRGSQRRSGVARQDSATLPRGDVLFLSSSSPVPPVPPLREKAINPVYQSTINSGASTDSEYPMSTPSPAVSASTKASPSTVPNKTPKRKVLPTSARPRIVKEDVFDGPKTAIEVSLPVNSRETVMQQGQLSLSLEGHTLDEFDFVPLGPLMVTASPDSDSGASYVALVPKRNGTICSQWARRIGGSYLVRSRSKDSSYPLSSATMSEHDYGELLNYDLTVSPGSGSSSHLPSSVSGGYQTFPETPVVFSPLDSPGYTFLARSDSQLRKPRPSPKCARPGIGKSYSSLRVARADNKDGAGTHPRRSRSYSQPVRSSLSPPQEKDEVDKPDDTVQVLVTGPGDSLSSLKLQGSIRRRHRLAHISSSSASLPEDEALRALAEHSSLSLPSILKGDVAPLPNAMKTNPSFLNSSVESPASIPLPESANISPSTSPASTGSVMAPSPFLSPLQSSATSSATATSPSPSSKSPLSAPPSSLGGSPLLPSPLSSASLHESHSQSVSAAQIIPGASGELASRPPSFLPPPPYHVAVSERTSHHPGSTIPPSVSRTSPVDPGYQRNRQGSDSSATTRTRMRARPPLPIGPRRPSAPAQILGAFVPGVHDRNGSRPSVGGSGSPKSVWSKLQSAASKHAPKFQTPPPKWRGLTLEAAHWTFTSAQLHEIVSQAIRQSSECSSLRLLRPETLDGEIADEVHRLELQHTEVKRQYRELVRKRWMFMGALAGHIEGTGMNDTLTASRTMEELMEVMSALDHLAEKMHEISLQLSQLKSLRDVHNASALAMVVRKINGLFVRQMAEKERLMEQVGVLRTEREEAWKHAENIAKDYDTLNDSMAFAGTRADIGVETEPQPPNSRRSTRISAVRKSSVRLSQSGLRSKPRTHHSSSSVPRPISLVLDDVPPIPKLPVNMSPLMASAIDSGLSLGSAYSSNATSEAWELAQAQREVYEMLGLSVPPSQASSRRRTISDPDDPKSPAHSSRPASESLDVRVRPRGDRDRATKSVTYEDRPSATFPLTIAQYEHIISPL